MSNTQIYLAWDGPKVEVVNGPDIVHRAKPHLWRRGCKTKLRRQVRAKLKTIDWEFELTGKKTRKAAKRGKGSNHRRRT